MKPSTIPLTCGVALIAMSTAGISHWWSVRQLTAAINTGIPLPASLPPPVSPDTKPLKVPAPPSVLAASQSTATPNIPQPRQKDFYEALISKMESLQNQNRDLLDQVAETNRDLMKLEFRVDTHSESFRPLPTSEERSDTSFEDEPGVQPPRANPVLLPSFE